MYNALVTRLKGVVSDSSLPKYGLQDFVAIANTSTRQVNRYTPPVPYRFKAKITSGESYFTIGTDTSTHLTEVDVKTGNNYDSGYVNFVKVGDDIQYELDVYNSSSIIGVLKLDDLLASDSVYTILCQQGTSSMGTIASSGSINEFGTKFPNLCEFQAQWLSGITGDLVTGFGSCKYIRYVAIRNTKVTGALEDLCSALLAAGKEGPLGIICNNYITYNGAVVGNGTQKSITFANGGYTIS